MFVARLFKGCAESFIGAIDSCYTIEDETMEGLLKKLGIMINFSILIDDDYTGGLDAVDYLALIPASSEYCSDGPMVWAIQRQ